LGKRLTPIKEGTVGDEGIFEDSLLGLFVQIGIHVPLGLEDTLLSAR
jgi:hypothetical protein